jgi:predicted DNA-binding transcriptional regulator AlpA
MRATARARSPKSPLKRNLRSSLRENKPRSAIRTTRYITLSRTDSSARAAFAKKAAARKASAENVAQPVRLLNKREILAITGLTFPTIWKMMRAGTFPRSRVVGQKSLWLSTDLEQWLAGLPIRRLKGDGTEAAA